MSSHVLIVGAGPFGLTLAAELTRYGVRVRIIDKVPARTDKSKALVLWSRTLELLERGPGSARFIDAGFKVDAANMISGDKLIGHVDMSSIDSPHNYALMLPQADTERLEERLGTADDHRDADGVEALDFSQAQRKVLEEAKHAAELASGRLYTVADAAKDYVDFMRAHRKSAEDAHTKLKAYVIPRLGAKRVSDLTTRDFEEWLGWALKRKSAKARKPEKGEPDAIARKGKPGPKPKVTPRKTAVGIDPTDLARRKKSTVNRVIATLKACLNYAHASKRVKSRDAWSLLRKFRAVDSARTRWLTLSEVTRLMNASAPDLRKLISGALMTGCREGELLAASARDFDSRSKTLLVPDSKSGKPRRVPLTDEGVSFFEVQTAGKLEGDKLFRRSDGAAWYRVAIVRAMGDACLGAKIDPPATFYTLRHTYASHLVQQETPLLFVASALGHRDARMVEKHYGHLAPSHVADMIRARLPSFGVEIDQQVRDMR